MLPNSLIELVCLSYLVNAVALVDSLCLPNGLAKRLARCSPNLAASLLDRFLMRLVTLCVLLGFPVPAAPSA